MDTIDPQPESPEDRLRNEVKIQTDRADQAEARVRGREHALTEAQEMLRRESGAREAHERGLERIQDLLERRNYGAAEEAIKATKIEALNAAAREYGTIGSVPVSEERLAELQDLIDQGHTPTEAAEALARSPFIGPVGEGGEYPLVTRD